jgi:short-subunit dehydrogenase
MRAWPLLLLVPAAALLLSRNNARPAQRATLAGKTFVVTGASSGVGRGTALALASAGANVAIAARRTSALEALAQEMRDLGGTPLVVTTDVSDVAQMQALAQQTLERFSVIDGWINNAGIASIGRFEDVPLEDHLRLLDVNLKGVVTGSYLAMGQFRIQGHGTLVNVGSVDSEIPHAYQASYSASKAGVLMLGRVLNEELRLKRQPGVHVSTVMPWALDTPLWDHVANYTGHAARMPTMDDPQKVVDAIIQTLLRPQKEIAVGYKAKLAYYSHRVTPGLNERLSGLAIKKAEVEMNPAMPDTSGSFHEPVDAGQRVDGGIRERLRAEQAGGI